MRPLVFDFPQDHRALAETHSYMFGRALHVAPVLAEAVSHWPVYLPLSEGGWFDFWTGEHRAGGASYDVGSPLEIIPLHARAGTILPLGPVLQSTAEATGERIDLYVFPGRDGAFELYEDDGLSNRYEAGACSRIPMRWDDRRGELQIDVRRGSFPNMPAHRTFFVHRVGPGSAPLAGADGLRVEYSGRVVRLRLG